MGGFDAWLRKLTDNHVTLDDLQNVAGALPVVGNLIAAGDLLVDLYEISQKRDKADFVDWMGVGINGIGLIPAPGTAALRVTMRPVLGGVRMALIRSGKVIGPALVDTIVAHILASKALAEKVEDAVQKMMTVLPGVLKDVADFVSKVIDQFAGFLRQIVTGQVGKYRAVPKGAVPGKGSFVRNPQVQLKSMFGAVCAFYREAATAVASKAASMMLNEKAKKTILGLLDYLTKSLKPMIAGKITALASETAKDSLMALLKLLLAAIKKRFSKAKAQGAALPGKRGKVVHRQDQKTMEYTSKQEAAARSANSCKSCAGGASSANKSKHSIGYALGDETLSHTDFVLPGVMPLVWLRTYNSRLAMFDDGELGARWITAQTTRFDLVVEDGSGKLVYHDAEGRTLEYPALEVGAHHQDRTEGLMLSRVAEDLLTVTRGHELLEVYELHGQRFQLALLKDRAGNTLAQSYDATGRLTRIVLGDGSGAVLERDDAGRISRILSLPTDDAPIPRVLASYVYDAQGDLVSATDENGHTREYRYQHHLITRYTDRTGRGINLEWDGVTASARAIREYADGGSDEIRLRWDDNIRLTVVTDAYGGETWYYADLLGFTYRVIYPDFSEEWFFRDDHKNLIKHTHPDGTNDRYAYDERDNLVEHIRPDGSMVRMVYDAQDQLIEIIDPLEYSWRRQYDDKGNLAKEIDPKGRETQYAYNAQGLPVQIKDAKGGVKQLAYNASGQLLSYTDCSGKATSWQYDARGRVQTATDAAGGLTQYHYGKDGNLASVQNPDGSWSKLEYDAEGRLLTHTDTLDRATRYGYDKAGRISARTDALNQQLGYSYDKLGRLTTLVNENGDSYRFAYDPVGRLLEETAFDGMRTAYQYETASDRLLSVNEAGQQTDLDYDHSGRLLRRRSGASEESFRYDPLGRLAEARNRYSTVHFWFDEVGSLDRESHHYRLFGQTRQFDWRHEYDELDNRIASVRPDGSRVDWLTYGSGHVHGVLWNSKELASFERDDLHRETARTLANRLSTTTEYDAMGRVLQQQVSGATQINRRYRYDLVDQLLSISDSRSGDTSYRYDPVGRLLAAVSPQHSESFAFDPASNVVDPGRPQQARSSAATSGSTLPPQVPKALGNLLKDYAGTHFDYDARGNLIRKQNGGEVSRFSWDEFNRLTKAETEKGRAEYAYDAFGRRIGKQTAGATTLFLWDGDVLASEDDGTTQRHYLFEANSFVPLAQVVQRDGQKHTGYYHVDHLGTPQLLTDAAGQIAWSAEYKAWGEAKEAISDAAKAAGMQNPLRFQGQYADEETGLHYNRHRYYDPEVGRFVSKDPIGLLGGLNTHAYAPNPVGWVDPRGLAPSKPNAGKKCQKCDPCAGKDPAKTAKSWQGTAPYSGVDSYRNTVVKKGTVLHTLYPHGNAPGNYLVKSTEVLKNGNAKDYNDALQLSHEGNTPGARPMRTSVHAYVVKEDTCMAVGAARANPHLGAGGGVQYFIENGDKGNLIDTGKMVKLS
ncbi:hypothetical protein BJP62_01610 [Jeongeupia sp. USM3]|nr:hypothetical protein BJP62_01610 [Jeongeupia sp. USM3]